MDKRKWMVLWLLAAVLSGPAITSAARLDHMPPASPVQRMAPGTVWASGWVDIAPGQTKTFTHNLGGDPACYAVDVTFRDTRPAGLGIHRRAYGGMNVGGDELGAYWHNLTASSISITRLADDLVVDQVSLRVWIPDVSFYDSGWLDIDPGETIPVVHNQGGDADDYSVSLVFRDTSASSLGIHHYAYGGLEAAGSVAGGAWKSLTNTAIDVQRWGGDQTAPQMRLLISHPDPPDYDSGWQEISVGEMLTLTHDLGGNPGGYMVRVSTRSAALGINSWAAGGLEAAGSYRGLSWEGLTNSTIVLYRRPHDPTAEQARVRIWVADEEKPAGTWQSWTNANYVHSLAPLDGVVWAGTEGGAVRWNPATGQYTKFLASDGLGDGDVNIVAPAASGIVWFGTRGGGLAAYGAGSWQRFTTSDGLPNDYVYDVAFQDGLLWVTTDHGLGAFDDGGTLADKMDDTWTTFRTEDGLSNNNVRVVALDSSGRKWLGVHSKGLDLLDDAGTPHDKSDDIWTHFTTTDGLVHAYVYGVLVDGQDFVWSATTGGLSVLDFAGTPFEKSDDAWMSFTPADGLADDDVYDLALDSQNRLWMATYGGGIFVLDHGGTPLDKSDDTWTQFSTGDGLVSRYLYAVSLDESTGQVWAGSWGLGISRLDNKGSIADRSDDTWTTFATADPLPDNTVYTLLPSGDHIWLGTTGGGLSVTDGDTWTTFTAADGLGSSYVYAIALEAVQWLGTSWGLSSFDDGGTPHDKADDAWATFRIEDGLHTDIIYGLDLDASGRLWAASQPELVDGESVPAGLSVLDDGDTPLDKSDDIWMTYLPVDSGGVCDGRINGLATDGSRWVWVATSAWWDGSQYLGGGLVLLDHAGTPFDKSDDAWTVFTTADGLAFDSVNAVVLDDAGRVWTGTASGLSVLDHAGTPFDKSDDTWTLQHVADGLAGTSVWAILFDSMGRSWLATSEGLNILDTGGTVHDKSDDVWITWTTEDGLVDNYVYSVALDGRGCAWLGAATGLSRLCDAVRYPLYLPLLVRG